MQSLRRGYGKLTILQIQAANRAVSRQFILITPQAMGTIRADNNVKIHK